MNNKKKIFKLLKTLSKIEYIDLCEAGKVHKEAHKKFQEILTEIVKEIS